MSHEDGYQVPSPRYGFRFEAVSRLGNATLAQILPFVHYFFTFIEATSKIATTNLSLIISPTF